MPALQISSQKHRLQTWVDIRNSQQENWGKVKEIYADEGISAKDMNRPAFQKMIRDLKRGKVNLILVTELSRLSRSIMDFCYILDILKANKAGFLSIKEQFDTSTPAGEMMVFNMINLAQFERKQVAERVSLNFHSRAMRGLLNGGQPPLGYDKDKNKRCTYSVNESEAAQVREIFRSYLSEGSLARAAQALNEKGIQPKQNPKRKSLKTWNIKNLNQLLRNRVYIGEREVNAKYRNEDQKTLKTFQKYSVVKASWTAIVDLQLFNEVQAQLEIGAKSERSRISKGVYSNYWLSGIIKCPDCGKGFVGACAHGRNEVHRYYIHPVTPERENNCRVKRVRAHEIESKVEKHLGEILALDGHFEGVETNIAKSQGARLSDGKSERVDLEKRLNKIDLEIDRLFDAQMTSNSIVRELFEDRLVKLGEDKKGIQIRLSGLAEEVEDGNCAQKRADGVREHIVAFNKGWSKATGAERKRLSRRVLSRLVPSERGLEVFYLLDGNGSDVEKIPKSESRFRLQDA